MGTIPRSSSHSPFATEAAYGVRLLLFDRLIFLIQDQDFQPVAFGSCLLQYDLPAVLSSGLAIGLPGRSVLQAADVVSRRIRINSENRVPKLVFS
ncbi:MAG: hypothetical protein WAW07_07075 [Bacteroidales bacterium]